MALIPSTAVNMTSGMYFIRFSDDTQQWTDKFVRQ